MMRSVRNDSDSLGTDGVRSVAANRNPKVAHASSVSSKQENRTQDACTTLCRPMNPVRFADTTVAHASSVNDQGKHTQPTVNRDFVPLRVPQDACATSILSDNTKAVLLLTAPLIVKRGGRPDAALLKPAEYNRLARLLRDAGAQPADLLGDSASELLRRWETQFDPKRMEALLSRGFQLSQAVNGWQSRAIWVISRADPAYPKRIKARLRENSPPVLYGCGEASLADTGGLAVVGSRKADDALLKTTREVGRMAADGGVTIVSGGARGVDSAAMEGALEAGGAVVGVLADSLGRAAVAAGSREAIRAGRLLLLSPFDPAAGFNVGNAMQRNKYIYALADAGLVMCVEHKKGGTWAGADEQLRKLHFCPVYVRAEKPVPDGNRKLIEAGARAWPDDMSSNKLREFLETETGTESKRVAESVPYQASLFPDMRVTESTLEPSAGIPEIDTVGVGKTETQESGDGSIDLDEAIFRAIEPVLLQTLSVPHALKELSEKSGVSGPVMKRWLDRLCEEGLVEKTKKPQRYVVRK